MERGRKGLIKSKRKMLLTGLLSSSVLEADSEGRVVARTTQKVGDLEGVDHSIATVPEIEKVENLPDVYKEAGVDSINRPNIPSISALLSPA